MSIIILLVILVNLTPVQNFLAQRATSWLAQKLHTKVTLKHVRLDILSRVSLEGLYIEDQKGDTLLYAGDLQVRITDWFIMKDKPVISYAGLRYAYVNLHRPRNSDQWNYQFVLDAFASKPVAKKDKTSSQPQIDLRKIDLEAVRFHMVDEWTGSDMIGELTDFELDARKVDFKQKIIDIKSIEGRYVTFGLRDYEGGRPPKPKQPYSPPPIDTTPFNPGRWKISAGKLQLEDSRFFLLSPDYKPIAGEFDAAQMDITGIQFDARDIAIKADTITADLRMLKAKDRSGIEIKKMSAQVTVSPRISECRDLYLETNNSILKDYYAMRYNRFPDFLDYITNVTMVGRLQGSKVAVSDIAYFAPALKQWKDAVLKVNGSAEGTVAKLRAKNLDITDGTSFIKGNVAMTGLPDIDKTIIDFTNGELSTSARGAYTYAPALAKQTSVDLGALRQVYFKGSFFGYWNDFAVKGNINTGIGSIRADTKLKFPASGNPLYSGQISSTGFELGKFLHTETVGSIVFDTRFSGNGFDPVVSTIKLDGLVSRIGLNGYDYQNVSVQGSLQNKKFAGQLKAADPNLALDFDGAIDLSGEQPLFDLVANVGYFNAKAVGLTDQNIAASGIVVFNFTGDNIDNFVGDAFIRQLAVFRDSTRLNIDSMSLSSRMEGRKKDLWLRSGNLSAHVNGEFSIIDLPSSVQLFLSYYLPQYVAAPDKINADQNLEFEVTTANTDDLVSLFSNSLRIGSGTVIGGTLNMWDQQLQLTGNIPSIAYGSINLNNIEINADGNYSGLHLLTTINGITNGQSDLASTVQFQTNIYQDSARFELLTTTPTSLGKAQVNGIAYANNDSFYLQVLPSEFYLNQHRWEIPEGNSIVFAENYLDIDDLFIQSGVQKISINSDHKATNNSMVAELENLDVSPLFRLANLQDMELDGRVNGTIKLSSALKDQVIELDMKADGLVLNRDTLGAIQLKGSYDVAKSLITLQPESGLHYKESRLTLEGKLSLDPASTESINGRITFDNALLAWVEPFLYGFAHDVTGKANGEIVIKGNADRPMTTGTLHLEDARFIPDITGVHYHIEEGDIAVTDTKFDLGTITVTDDMGNEAELTGTITHDQLSRLNLRMRMNSDNIQVLNLKDFDGQSFYGNVMSSVQMRLNGPFSDLKMNISATPSKNSHLFIPISTAGDLSEYDYIKFKQYGETPEELKVAGKNKFSITIDAVATPDLECTIILDAGSGDEITAKGSGNIILEIPSVGDMRLNGNYIIDEGKYNFSFKQLQVLKYTRQFIINPGSVIKWNGDISDADLDVNAYTQIKARLYDLIMNDIDRVALTSQEVRDAQLMQMINVQMNMQGSLNTPKFNFKIDLAENRSIGTYAYQKLQRINTDDKELLNQVAALLLLEQFIPPEGFNSSAAVSTGTINNMSELASTFASSQITNFTNKVLGMQDLYVGVRYKNYNLANSDNTLDQLSVINRNEAGINLRKNFFNNRLVVDVGGVYDWGRTSASQNTITDNLAGDFRVQYLLTEDGRIRFNIFRQSNYDAIFQQNIARNGVGLTYRKSFNSLLDFFRSETALKQERERDQLRRSGADTSHITTPARRGYSDSVD